MLQELINKLQEATEPSRVIDTEIALLCGYKLVSEGGPWLSPSGEHVNRVPLYTEIIDNAMEFAERAGALAEGGCSWETGMGSAVIEPGYPAQACNTAIAICIAVLERVQRKRANNG